MALFEPKKRHFSRSCAGRSRQCRVFIWGGRPSSAVEELVIIDVQQVREPRLTSPRYCIGHVARLPLDLLRRANWAPAMGLIRTARAKGWWEVLGLIHIVPHRSRCKSSLDESVPWRLQEL